MAVRRSSYASICTLTMALLAQNALANGGVWDTPHRAAGNVLISSKRLALQREELEIRLNAVDYTAKVTYFTTDHGGQAKQTQTAMYFPVICHDFTEMKEDPKKCTQSFQAQINGQAVKSRLIPPAEVEKSKMLAGLAKKINARSRQKEDEDLPPSQYVFFKTELPAAIVVQTLSIQYQARYRQIMGGTSKSPRTGYGPAQMIYDFSPAISWAGSNIDELQIRLDTEGLQGPLQYNSKHWPFVFQDKRASLTLKRPDFAKMPPLVLATDNAGYQSHTDFMAQLRRGQTAYRFSVIKAQPVSGEYGDIRALSDRNPDTFWCWRGRSAILLAHFDPAILSNFEGDPGYFYLGRLSALGVLNGAVRDPQVYAQYGLAKKITARAKVLAEQEKMDPGLDQPSWTLPRPVMKNTQDRFMSHWLIEDLFYEEIDIQDPIQSKELLAQHRKTIKSKEYIIEIKDVHKRKDSDESCISELYPVYRF